MKRKVIGGFLCAVLAASMLTGCGAGKGNSGQEDGEVTIVEDDPSKQMDISIWQYSQEYKYYNSYNDNPAVWYLDQKFNVNIEFQMPPMGSERDNFNIMLSTGEYTDLMCTTYSTDSMTTLYEDGTIIDLTPYVEKYMPNYYAELQKNDELRKMAYDDDGRIYAVYQEDAPDRGQWGGFVYRRDILETMTGGNVVFPSGNEEPTTVEDWEYMLPLMKAYFDASGIAETAALIIPACGYVTTGELENGFGTSGTYQLASDKKTVEYGPVTDNFYHYVTKMRDWYANGYIYKDFASRTNDMFYLPNTSLTYGGAAGVWFGLEAQLGTAMSMPEYGLNIQVNPLTGPLDTEHGVNKEDAGFMVYGGAGAMPWCISTSCDESKYARIFSMLDYLYTDEGCMLRKGLTAEQAKGNPVYEANGLYDGVYYFDKDGNYCLNELFLDGKSDLDQGSFVGNLIVGKAIPQYEVYNKSDEGKEKDRIIKAGQQVWGSYGRDRILPPGMTMTTEESIAFNSVYTNILDYVDSMIPKFIMGTEELDEETWKAYVDQVEALGLQKALDAKQGAYDRYLTRE